MAAHDELSTAAPRATLVWVGEPRLDTHRLPYAVACFEDSDDFLLAPAPFDFDAFVIHSVQRGVGGLDLVRLLRRRTAAGIVAVCDDFAGEFVAYLGAGADMVLGGDAPAEHVAAAVAAVVRRAAQSRVAHSRPWRLLEADATLETPDGKTVPLSESDVAILQCFAAGGGKVERRALIERLWGADTGALDNALHATVYRLRKRIEQTGHTPAPVYTLPKVGYEFRAPLAVVSAAQPPLPGTPSNMSRKSR